MSAGLIAIKRKADVVRLAEDNDRLRAGETATRQAAKTHHHATCSARGPRIECWRERQAAYCRRDAGSAGAG